MCTKFKIIAFESESVVNMICSRFLYQLVWKFCKSHVFIIVNEIVALVKKIIFLIEG